MSMQDICKQYEYEIIKYSSKGIYTIEEFAKIIGVTKGSLRRYLSNNNISWKRKKYIKHNIKEGDRFNYLTVVKEIEDAKKRTFLCKCDCGNYTKVTSDHLISGHTKSCGCFQKKQVSKMYEDLTGKRFGKLVVINLKGSYRNPMNKKDINRIWYCKCECGEIIEAPTSLLKSGKKVCCEKCCSKKSTGEMLIENILNKNNINFKKEYTFPSLVSDNNRKLRFDFAILDNNNQLKYLIEFDGEQHYQKVKYFTNQEDGLKRDKQKNKFCLENNICLIRIPYYELKNINIDLLTPKTTNKKYIVKKVNHYDFKT